MTPQQTKIFRIVFTIFCIIGGGGFIYVGYVLFKNRISIFWIYSAYIVVLTGIVVFFGYKLTGVDPFKTK